MSRAMNLIEKLNHIAERIPYLGQYNDYSGQPYDQDSAEFMRPFADLQLPDKTGQPDSIQTAMMPRKSRIEDQIPNPIQ